jgi:hypothetical protein
MLVCLLRWSRRFGPASPRVAKDLLATTDIDDSPTVEVLTQNSCWLSPFKVLHRLDMAERSKSLSRVELDLVEFLVAEVTLLSFSLAYEAPFAESSVPTLVVCQVLDLQFDVVGRMAETDLSWPQV